MNIHAGIGSNGGPPIETWELPPAFAPMVLPRRFKVTWGGRGSAKSWTYAQLIVGLMYSYPLKVLCAREYQNSIGESVHALLKAQITRMGLDPWFHVTNNTITSHVGAEVVYRGLHNNVSQIKSLEGIDICWVEEAHSTTDDSWKYLIPTIRRSRREELEEKRRRGRPITQMEEFLARLMPDSEIWVSFNQHDDKDPTYVRFVTNPPPNAWVLPVTYEDNPYLTGPLREEMEYHRLNDPETFDWIWGTQTRRIGSAVIFQGRWVEEEFDDPDPRLRTEFRYGLDFGYSTDPTACVRSWITGPEGGAQDLWISHEAFGLGVELDDVPALLGGGRSVYDERSWVGMPGMRWNSDTEQGGSDWPIYADSSQPQQISYLARKGFRVVGADKWPGSVEDGLAHLKRFRRIHIHQRCKNMLREARLYSYKTDRLTGEVLPVIVDKHNHGWDAERYALSGYIQRAGGLGLWARLAG